MHRRPGSRGQLALLAESDALTRVSQQPVIDLPPVTDQITPKNRIPHTEEYFVHPERVVLGDLFRCIESDPGEGLYRIPLDQDIMVFSPSSSHPLIRNHR